MSYVSLNECIKQFGEKLPEESALQHDKARGWRIMPVNRDFWSSIRSRLGLSEASLEEVT